MEDDGVRERRQSAYTLHVLLIAAYCMRERENLLSFGAPSERYKLYRVYTLYVNSDGDGHEGCE